MKINLKVRLKNAVFIVEILLAVITPVLAYTGITGEDITTWGKLGDILIAAAKNPHVIGLVLVSVFNAVNDPTTTGITDSKEVLGYKEPDKK